jgi:threonyl-tRNA synthetase
MNCPYHVQIYNSRLVSYRELPLRFAELGTVYRYERSGVMHGLFRVRGFTQDDAHIFTHPSELEKEVTRTIRFCLHILNSFGFTEFKVFVSTKPEKYVGTDENWERATDALIKSLNAVGLAFEIDPGEGVFYGPKIDIKIKDSLQREWQCSTIQVDFNLPDRFAVRYTDSDGEHRQPIMIHRALLGSIERFFGVLIEHTAGNFPLWLAPVQVTLLTVTDRADEYAQNIKDRLDQEGIRIHLDLRNEKLGLKIREAKMQKIPYLVVLGDAEVTGNTLSVTSREGEKDAHLSIDEFLSKLHKRLLEKK